MAGAFALVLAGTALAADIPANIAAAVADGGRPADQTGRDAARKPAEILAFAGVKTGDKVGDFIMGGGYFTRLFSVSVGPAGKVYAYQPAEFIQFQASYGADQDKVAAAYANVTPLKNSLAAVAFPEPLDVIFTAQNYHDLHLGFIPTQSKALHRIDIETVKKELTAAGFVLEASSELLRQPADPRTASVFDASIKGRTDQFVLKFRKPGKAS
jgi:predicted methyltransferase